ncbi:Ldh family oxidoreductase [Stygiolobus caldivivus]|uniref:Malate/L-lactate dehydrogenase n=1 Tax=Stygiolobus caldivivus TaxID=2824673 RepID=A0A8D5UAD6_9CREN|nr:Ldh family oxidoreductase [Stygiolobus caldivivus]BCU71631.1 hypothetical protein KN1_29280 [Stygiolobus caldivivus]
MQLKIEEVIELIYRIFKKITYDQYAVYISEELAESEVDGHPDHGLQLIPYYLELAKGNPVDIGGTKVRPINPKAEVEIKGENLVEVNGNFTFGQVVLRKTVEYLVKKDLEYYVIFGKNVSHIGRLATFTRRLGAKGYISIIMARSPPLMALKGMTRRVVGNNPISIGSPELVIDTALSVTSFGNALHKLIRGEKFDEEVIVDKDGNLSRNPEDLIKGGSLLPIGGYKGFNLALGIDLITSSFAEDTDVNPFFAVAFKNRGDAAKKVIPKLPKGYPLLVKKRKEVIEVEESVWNKLKELA